MGFSLIADSNTGTGGGGGAPVVQGSGYPVSYGFGALFGGPAGAVPRDIILEGSLRGFALDGKTQSPIIYNDPAEQVVASAIIDATSSAMTLIPLIGGIDAVEFTRVSFRKFSALSPANLSGGIYAAEPVGNVWSEQAAIIPNGTVLGGLSGMQGKRVEAFHQFRHPDALWYRPGVVSATPLTFEVSIWGMPVWALRHARPKA